MQIRELQQNWNEFGKQDPLWAILTDPGKQGNRWDLEEFFETGRQEIDDLVAFVEALGVSLQHGEALDFGCGVGRLTQALAARFDSATGVDIAPSMLDLAAEYNRQAGRCKYLLNAAPDLSVLESDRFSFVYSNYVLQHMRPEYALRYVTEFVRVLRPGGTLVFQLPASTVGLKERVKAVLPAKARKAYRRVATGGADAAPVMETYSVPRATVEDVLRASGAEILHVRSNPNHDRRWNSLLYYVTRSR
jgi:SAM-dependent methyltransferase